MQETVSLFFWEVKGKGIMENGKGVDNYDIIFFLASISLYNIFEI